MDKGAKKKLKPTIKRSLIYTKPNRKKKTNSNTYVIKKEGKWQGGCTRGWEDEGGAG
jgi:hypothetical protein